MAKMNSQGRPKRNAYRKLNLNLSADLIDKLDAEAEQTGTPRSRLIERRLRQSYAKTR